MKSVSQGPPEPGNLISCHLLEVGKDGSVLWTWSYPILDNRLRRLCLRKCNILLNLRKSGDGDELREFRYFHLDDQWFYVFFSGHLPPPRPSSDPQHPFTEIRQIGVLVGASDFSPEKYELVAEILFRSYLKTEDPSVILQQFLGLVVEGKCLLPKKKTFTLTDHDSTNPFSQHSVKDIISRFGLESILIYTALTRKRRIVVYHYDVDVLMQVVLSMPALVQDSVNLWNAIYPWVELGEEEVSYLKDVSFYIMGCTNAGVENRSDLFDVFVNVPAAEISVAPHAKEGVSMNKSHKEIALFMVQLASNDEVTEDEVVQGIFRKTKELADIVPAQKPPL